MNVTKKNWYLTQFDLFDKNVNGKKNTAISQIRDTARQQFSQLEFPTTQNESWKYTNLAPVLNYNFEPVIKPDPRQDEVSPILPYFMDSTYRMVFVNGLFRPELSALKNIPKKAVIKNINDAFRTHPDLLNEYMGKQCLTGDSIFPAMNYAMLNDGALIVIPDGMVLDSPVHLIFYTATNGRYIITQPSVMIVAGKQSQVNVMVHSIGESTDVYLTNSVTEITADASSKIDYSHIQCEGAQAYHIQSLFSTQAADSRFSAHSFTFGSVLARNDVYSVLNGSGSECALNGLFTTGSQQHSDHSTVIDHAKPNCISREVYKGILNGKSTGSFNGKIIVRPGAQKTDARQSNNNLLLSKEATMNTRPQLEIFADDVKCTHGATIGRIDETALFYLRSRGIDLFKAQSILTAAFALQLVESLPWEPLRKQLESRIGDHFNFKN